MNIKEYRKYIDTNINSIIIDIKESNPQMGEIVEYALLPGGKRIRPMILNLLSKANGVENNISLAFELALEFIHSYSLVHDDLPAMDDDDYRRNKLTVHKKYDEASAILAGDALLNLSIETSINQILKSEQIDSKNIFKALNILYSCSGIIGMIGGQYMDMNMAFDREYLINMIDKKTGALFVAASLIPAQLANRSDNELELYRKLGINIGRAFQILDDLNDLAEDINQNKITFATVLGREESEKYLKDLKSEYHELATILELEKSEFDFLIRKMIYERL